MLKAVAKLCGIIAVNLVLLVPVQSSWSLDAYIGSNADASFGIYRLPLSSNDDRVPQPFLEIPRTGKNAGQEFAAMALRPASSELYCFIGAEISICDLLTNDIRTLNVPGERLEYFEGPILFSPSGHLLYVLSFGETGVRGLVLNSDDLSVIGAIQAREDLGYPGAVAFTPDATGVYVGRQRRIVRCVVPPVDGGLEIMSRDNIVLAELSASRTGSPRRLTVSGEKIIAVETVRDETNAAVESTVVTTISEGGHSDVRIKGELLTGEIGGASLYTLERSTETVRVYAADGSLQKSIVASLSKLVEDGEFESTQTEAEGIEYRLGGGKLFGYPTFTSGYVSPDYRFAVLTFDHGIRMPSYTAVVDLTNESVSPASRLGAVEGGVTNVVFVP